MYAVIETAGSSITSRSARSFRGRLLDGGTRPEITLDRVLLVADGRTRRPSAGPLVAGAVVSAPCCAPTAPTR